MRSTKVTESIIRSEKRCVEGDTYEYKLTVSEGSSTSNYRILLYSIEVDFHGADGNSTNGRINEAFADPGRAIIFYERLVNNLATPVDLPYVLEDSIK